MAIGPERANLLNYELGVFLDTVKRMNQPESAESGSSMIDDNQKIFKLFREFETGVDEGWSFPESFEQQYKETTGEEWGSTFAKYRRTPSMTKAAADEVRLEDVGIRVPNDLSAVPDIEEQIKDAKQREAAQNPRAQIQQELDDLVAGSAETGTPSDAAGDTPAAADSSVQKSGRPSQEVIEHKKRVESRREAVQAQDEVTRNKSRQAKTTSDPAPKDQTQQQQTGQKPRLKKKAGAAPDVDKTAMQAKKNGKLVRNLKAGGVLGAKKKSSLGWALPLAGAAAVALYAIGRNRSKWVQQGHGEYESINERMYQ